MHEENSREYWWNVSVKTAMKVPQNKPDPIIWNHETKICSILEFCCLLCIYINIKVNEKLENYGPLFRNLQIMYPKLLLLLLTPWDMYPNVGLITWKSLYLMKMIQKY